MPRNVPTAGATVHAGAADDAGRLTTALVLLATTELLLLRTLTRTAIHIPGIERTAAPYRLVAEAGRLAYYLAVVVLVLVLIAVIASGFRRAVPPRGVAVALTLFIVAAVSARLDLISAATLALAIVMALGLTLSAVRQRVPVRRAWPVLALGGALLVSVLHGLLQPAHVGIGSRDVSWLLLVAEALAVAGAIAAPLLVPGGRDTVALRFAVPVFALSSAALLTAGPTVKILLLWNVGVAGYLPDLLYAVAASTVAYAIMAARARDRRISYGLALLVLGGVGLQSTYQTGVFLAGLATLARATGAGIAGAERSRRTAAHSATDDAHTAAPAPSATPAG